MTTAELETMREELQKAIFGGVLRISFSGRTIEYRSIAEMKQALAAIDAELSSSTTYRYSYGATSKG